MKSSIMLTLCGVNMKIINISRIKDSAPCGIKPQSVSVSTIGHGINTTCSGINNTTIHGNLLYFPNQ